MASSLRNVFILAYENEGFLRRLVADPDKALAGAGLKLAADDLRQLKNDLRRGITLDLAATIRAARREGSTGDDPWPTEWPRW